MINPIRDLATLPIRCLTVTPLLVKGVSPLFRIVPDPEKGTDTFCSWIKLSDYATTFRTMHTVPPDLWPEFMARALRLAEEAASEDEVPVGAVIVVGERIIAEGRNLRETTFRTTAHAEVVALESYNEKFQTWRLPPGASLFVTAEPCLMCTGALLGARLDYLYYGCSDLRQAGLGRVQCDIEAGVFDHRFRKVVGGVEASAGAALLTKYFREKREP